MIKGHQSAPAVLAALREKLASATSDPAEVLDAVVGVLNAGRGYRWTGIYLAMADTTMLQSSSGPAPAKMTLETLRAEIAIPIKLGVRTLGLIVAESGRATGVYRDRVLLQQTAKLLARYFSTDRAKQLLRTTRQKTDPGRKEVQPHKNPQSARPLVHRAAAGE